MEADRATEIGREYVRRNGPKTDPTHVNDAVERVASSVSSLLPESEDWCIAAPIRLEDQREVQDREEILVLDEVAFYRMAISDDLAERITVERIPLSAFSLFVTDFAHVENGAQVVERRWTFAYPIGTRAAIQSRIITAVSPRTPDRIEAFGEAVARASGWPASTYPPEGSLS